MVRIDKYISKQNYKKQSMLGGPQLFCLDRVVHVSNNAKENYG